MKLYRGKKNICNSFGVGCGEREREWFLNKFYLKNVINLLTLWHLWIPYIKKETKRHSNTHTLMRIVDNSLCDLCNTHIKEEKKREREKKK